MTWGYKVGYTLGYKIGCWALLSVGLLFVWCAPALSQTSIDKIPGGIFLQKTPLYSALPLVLPAGIDVIYDENVDQNALVTIPYTRSWRKALSAALAQLELEAEIQGKTVFIFPCRLSRSCGGGLIFDVTPLAPEAIVPRSPRKKIPGQVRRRWSVQQGSFVEDVVKGWASLSPEGWSVVYEASNNYALTASATFEGTFVEATQQLFALLAPYTPLRATFYRGNHTIVVEDD